MVSGNHEAALEIQSAAPAPCERTHIRYLPDGYIELPTCAEASCPGGHPRPPAPGRRRFRLFVVPELGPEGAAFAGERLIVAWRGSEAGTLAVARARATVAGGELDSSVTWLYEPPAAPPPKSRWREFAELLEACVDNPPVGWRIVRSVVPDSWDAEHIATGGRWYAIIGTGYCGEVVPDEQRIESVIGDGELPPLEELEAALRGR